MQVAPPPLSLSGAPFLSRGEFFDAWHSSKAIGLEMSNHRRLSRICPQTVAHGSSGINASDALACSPAQTDNMSSSDKIILPDLVSSCPFKWSVNPHYERARDESGAWIDGFKVFTDRKRALFNIYNSELLPALAYPYAGFEELRTCCDFINLLFVFDEISDELAEGKLESWALYSSRHWAGSLPKAPSCQK